MVHSYLHWAYSPLIALNLSIYFVYIPNESNDYSESLEVKHTKQYPRIRKEGQMFFYSYEQ